MPAENKSNLIIDTNVLVSGFFYKGSVVRQAVTTGFRHYNVVFSTQTWDELTHVFQRDFLEKILPLAQRLRLLFEIASRITVVESKSIVVDCADAKDNKFLSLALDSGTQTIVTGDNDLLQLHPWRAVNIFTVHQFLQDQGEGAV